MLVSPKLSNVNSPEEYQFPLTDLHVHLTNEFTIDTVMKIAKEKNVKLHYGTVTSARNCGLSWRPVKFLEVFNDWKTFDADFGNECATGFVVLPRLTNTRIIATEGSEAGPAGP